MIIYKEETLSYSLWFYISPLEYVTLTDCMGLDRKTAHMALQCCHKLHCWNSCFVLKNVLGCGCFISVLCATVPLLLYCPMQNSPCFCPHATVRKFFLRRCNLSKPIVVTLMSWNQLCEGMVLYCPLRKYMPHVTWAK